MKISTSIEKYKYKRPDIKKTLSARVRVLQKIKFDSRISTSKIYDEWVYQRDKWNLYYTLSSIYLAKNYKDEFWLNELNYISDGNIEINKIDIEITEAFLKRGRSGQLSKYIGKIAFNKLRSKISSLEKDVLEISEYRSIQEWIDYRNSLKFKHNGKNINIHDLSSLLYSTKRKERKDSYNLIKQAFSIEKIDNVLNRLIHIRDEISKSSSFDNYEEFIESESFRDWDYKEAFYFKELVKEFIVPILVDLQDRKSQRLQIQNLENYDENVFFKGGNPKIKGNQGKIIRDCIESLSEFMNDDLHKLARDMYASKLIDATKRKYKQHGAYCWPIDGTKDSYILINTLNDSDLPETFFHEFGHSIHFYYSGDYFIPELRRPSREILEIPSITLELFSQDVFYKFYGDKSDDKKMLHIIGLLTLICKICILDDWQRIIYRNPNMSQSERNSFWENAEREFTPWLTPNPERWKQDYTIFESPFYDLDYGIATICGLQLWTEFRINKKNAIKKYIKLCASGGKRDFQETLKYAKIENPFNRKTFKNISKELKDFLSNY